MITLTFQGEYSYNPQPLAIFPVRILTPSGAPYMIQAVLDTGAWHSVFSHVHAQSLGISDITSGTPIPLVAADGVRARGYAHPVTIEFLGRRMTVPIGFCPDWPADMPNLLGMRGFFDKILVAFEHQREKMYF